MKLLMYSDDQSSDYYLVLFFLPLQFEWPDLMPKPCQCAYFEAEALPNIVTNILPQSFQIPIFINKCTTYLL